MNEVKFISFEMRVEFDIGETDYHVVWRSDKGKKQEKEMDEEKKEPKEMYESPNNFGFVVKSEDEENKEDPTDLVNLEEEEKTEEKEDTTKNAITENEKVFGQHTDVFRESWGLARLPDERNNILEKNAILEKNEDDDSTAVNIGSDDDKQDDVNQITNKTVNDSNEEENDKKEPMDTRENGFIARIELFIRRGTNVGETEINDNQNDMDQTEDMEVNEKNNQEDEIVSRGETPEESSNVDGVKSYLPAREEEERGEDVVDDVRQYILELGAGPRRIILAMKSPESSTPFFGQSTEGLEPEEIKNFGEAWVEAVFLCLERRVAAGHTEDEVMQEVVEELGLDKFQEIVEHFLGSMTVEQVEDEDEPEEDTKEASDAQE